MHPFYRQYSDEEVSLLLEYLKFDETSPTMVRWIKRPANCVRVGDPAGSYNTANGYMKLAFKGKQYSLHRVIWVLLYGADPWPLTVDHTNRTRTDNSPKNLRLADDSLQKQNRAYFQRTCKTSAPFKWIRQQASGSWVGQFGYLGKKYCTKTVKTPQEAYKLVLERRQSMGLPV